MKTSLSQIFEQYDPKGSIESKMKLTVEYDTVERRWTQLESIQVYNVKERVWTDITHIMFGNMHDQTESKLDEINWPEVYAESQPKRSTWNNLNPVFETALKPFVK